MWVHGPFPCGAYSDVTIFRLGLKEVLGPNELVIADSGYRDEKCCTPSEAEGEQAGVEAVIRARHETVNRRFKQFFALGHRFRHDISRHSSVFHAVANLTELMIEHDSPLFDVQYYE